MTASEPFKIDVPDATIRQILKRVRLYEWPEAPEDGGWAYGTSLEYMKELAAYWANGYDWRAEETNLNALSHFTAQSGGTNLHFVRERGSGTNPMPLILIHGWPGSFFEFAHVVEPLAHPERFGGSAEDAFDVVVPSLPGYGFSGKPKRPIGPARDRGALRPAHERGPGLRALPGPGRRLGERGLRLARLRPPRVLRGRPPQRGPHARRRQLPETEEEKRWDAEFRRVFRREGAYFSVQSTRPQSLAYAMTDSPVGTAAWIVEKFAAWSDLEKSPSGEPGIESRYTKDQLLTNVMIYLVTRTFSTASWLYRGFLDDGSHHLAGRIRQVRGDGKRLRRREQSHLERPQRTDTIVKTA